MLDQTPATIPSDDIPGALHRVRLALIDARREVDDCARWLAQREAELSMTVEGKNEGERKARLVLEMARDERIAQYHKGLCVAQEHVARLEAEENYLRDVRRSREWAARERLGLLEGVE